MDKLCLKQNCFRKWHKFQKKKRFTSNPIIYLFSCKKWKLTVKLAGNVYRIRFNSAPISVISVFFLKVPKYPTQNMIKQDFWSKLSYPIFRKVQQLFLYSLFKCLRAWRHLVESNVWRYDQKVRWQTGDCRSNWLSSVQRMRKKYPTCLGRTH